MNMTDPVADMITRIRNGVRAKLPKVDVPFSKLKVEIARILKNEGYIANYKVTEDGRQNVLRVYLKYGPGMERVITDLQRVCRPAAASTAARTRSPASTAAGHQHPLHFPRAHDRPERARGVGGEIL